MYCINVHTLSQKRNIVYSTDIVSTVYSSFLTVNVRYIPIAVGIAEAVGGEGIRGRGGGRWSGSTTKCIDTEVVLRGALDYLNLDFNFTLLWFVKLS